MVPSSGQQDLMRAERKLSGHWACARHSLEHITSSGATVTHTLQMRSGRLGGQSNVSTVTQLVTGEARTTPRQSGSRVGAPNHRTSLPLLHTSHIQSTWHTETAL